LNAFGATSGYDDEIKAIQAGRGYIVGTAQMYTLIYLILLR